MMSFFEPIIKLPLNPRLRLSKQIAARIIDLYNTMMPRTEIQLPPVRTLADLLQVSHGTVNLAYNILRREDIAMIYGSRGTFLKPYSEKTLQNANNFNVLNEEVPVYRRMSDLLPLKQEVAVLEMSSRKNHNRVLTKMQMALRSTILKNGVWRCSEEWLAEAIQKKLKGEGLFVASENIFIPSRGTALMTVASAILKADDLVVMDTGQDLFPHGVFCKLGCEVAFTGHKASQGMNMDVLEDICNTRDVRLVFIRADSSWPLGFVTSNDSRDQLIRLSKKYGFQIIAFEFESDYPNVKLPRRLSERQHDGKVIFISVISRASREFERTSYVVAEPRLIKILKYYDALSTLPRSHTFEQITAVMYENGSLGQVGRKLSYGHKKKLKEIAYILRYALKKQAKVIKPACGRFVVIQFYRPVHVKLLASLSVHLHLNYHERNKHLKEDQTVIWLRMEYTVFEKAEWELVARKLSELLNEKSITLLQDEKSSSLFKQKSLQGC